MWLVHKSSLISMIELKNAIGHFPGKAVVRICTREEFLRTACVF